jgi:hypothetical protein
MRKEKSGKITTAVVTITRCELLHIEAKYSIWNDRCGIDAALLGFSGFRQRAGVIIRDEP